MTILLWTAVKWVAEGGWVSGGHGLDLLGNQEQVQGNPLPRSPGSGLQTLSERFMEQWSRSLSQEVTRPSALYWGHLFAKDTVPIAAVTDAMEHALWF